MLINKEDLKKLKHTKKKYVSKFNETLNKF